MNSINRSLYSLFLIVIVLLATTGSAFACHPTLLCIEDLGSGILKAHFGFVGSESYLPIGSKNTFSGSPIGCTSVSKGIDCGQGTNFSASKILDHVQVRFSGSASVKWTLNGTSVTANSSSTRCALLTPTSTPTATWTATRTPTRTPTPQPTATSTPTLTPTRTPTVAPTATHTVTPIFTPATAPSSTPTPLPSPTLTRTVTPSATPSATATYTPTPEQTVTVCHVTNDPTNSRTSLSINESDLSEHLLHGDSLGNCITDCKGIPGGQAVVDRCGVCGGDDSTCKDCSGIVNGTATLDTCGVCGGDGSSCKGCDGVTKSGNVFDVCGVCGGDGSSCKDCNGIPNGGAVIDQCGMCGGSNNTCLDCAGVVNGTSVPDECGVCGGNGITCVSGKSCQGSFDSCGVCNGNNLCVDCAGVPNGGTTLDCCGVCGGDGSSCSDQCTYYHLSKEKKNSIKGFKTLYASVVKYSRQQMRCNPKTKSKATIRISMATKLSMQSWDLLQNIIEDEIKVCDTIFCKKTSLTQVLETLKVNLKSVYKLSREAQYGAISACGPKVRTVTGSNAGQRIFSNGVVSLKRIPPAVCTN